MNLTKEQKDLLDKIAELDPTFEYPKEGEDYICVWDMKVDEDWLREQTRVTGLDKIYEIEIGWYPDDQPYEPVFDHFGDDSEN